MRCNESMGKYLLHCSGWKIALAGKSLLFRS